jgi:hypothetical protein
VENRKQVSHFPLPCFPWFQQIQKGGLAAELRSSSRLIVRLENAVAKHQKTVPPRALVAYFLMSGGAGMLFRGFRVDPLAFLAFVLLAVAVWLLMRKR